jgi:hypothetical protein
MSESVLSWLRRAKAQPGTGNVPADLPSGRSQRKADELEAGTPAPAPTPPKNNSGMHGVRGSVTTPEASTATLAMLGGAAAAPNIGDTIAAAAKDSGLKTAETLNPEIRKTLPGINNTVAQATSEGAALGQQPAQPAQAPQPRPGIAASNPNVQKGGLSPEGKAWQANRPPLNAQPIQPPASGGIGGKVMGGLKAAGRLVAPVIGMMGAADALKHGTSSMDNTIAEEMGEVANRAYGQTPGENPRFEAAQNALRGAAVNVTRRIGNAAVPDFIAERAGDKVVGGIRDIIQGNPLGTTQFPVDPKSAPPPPPGNGQGMVQGTAGEDNSQPSQETIRKAQLEIDLLENQKQALRANASPEAGGTGISVGGLRGQAVGGGAGGRFQGAFDALSSLQGYGAESRLAKNQADVDTARAGLRLKGEAHQLEKSKFGYQMGKDQRDAALKLEESNEKEADRLLEGRAREKIKPRLIGLPGAQKLDPTQEGEVKAATSKLQNEYRHTAANMRDANGNKLSLGKLNQGQIQQIHMMDDIRNSLADSRETWRKSLGDAIGNKRADSLDLNDYRPVRTEPSSVPGVSKWVVLKSGERVPVTDIAGGKFGILANSPVHKQMMEMIDEAERKQKKGK